MSANVLKINCTAWLAVVIGGWSIGGCQQHDSAQYSSARQGSESCCQQHGTAGDNNACCGQAAPQPLHGKQLPVTLATIDESDKAGIARQRVCPVSEAELGSMGDPIKVLVDGKPLYLCCQGCVAKVKNAPETYLSKVNQSHQSQ